MFGLVDSWFLFFPSVFLLLFPFFLPALRLNEYCLLFHFISLIDITYTSFENILIVDPGFIVHIFSELESMLNYYLASPVV